MRLFFDGKFIKFLVIGGINTASSTGLAFLFTFFMQENMAFMLAYVASLSLAYALNTLFVFKVKPAFILYIRFCLSYIPNFLINNIVFALLFNTFGFNKYIAILLTACIGLPVTFICVKFYAFKKGKSQ